MKEKLSNFLVLLSLCIAKPMYAISFLPGLFIFILLKNFSNLKNFYSKFKFQIIFILISSFSIIGLSSFIVLKGYYSIDINPMAAWLIRTNELSFINDTLVSFTYAAINFFFKCMV